MGAAATDVVVGLGWEALQAPGARQQQPSPPVTRNIFGSGGSLWKPRSKLAVP